MNKDNKSFNKKDPKYIISELSKDLNLSEKSIYATLKGCGISLREKLPMENYPLYMEIVSCKYGLLDNYKIEDEEYLERLDKQIRQFDEVYIDTAPLIQDDWFLYFIANAGPVLRRRRKKLVVLEKTMEELHGIKNNEEKDYEVRLRAQIRPMLLQNLAKKGLIRKTDTGSFGIADDHLMDLLRRRGKNHAILLITQDRALSERVVCLENDLNKSIEFPHRTFLERVFKNKFQEEDIIRKVIVCRLLDKGILQRFYICPRCTDSYYDIFHDCDGFVLCSNCYWDLMIEDKKQKEKNELMEKKEIEKRKQTLNSIEKEKDILKETETVEKVLKRRKKTVSFIFIAFLLLVSIILLFVIT